MITLSELIEQTKGVASSADKKEARVKLRGDEPAPEVFSSLLDHFGKDDNRRGVHVELEGAESYYLSRPKLMRLVSVKKRNLSFGGADGGMLDGVGSYTLIKLCCPKGGCTESFWVMSFDEDNPPPCDVHADTKMEPCDESD